MVSQTQRKNNFLEPRDAKRVKLDDYQGNWRRLTDADWNTFHNQWWGEEGRKRLDAALSSQSERGKIVRIEQQTVCYTLMLLEETEGALLLHQELLDLYKRFKTAQSHDVSGVVLTGQPGVGKSTALAYILLERLTDKQPTFLTTSSVHVYKFDDTGIWEFSDSSDRITFRDVKIQGLSERVWSLIDANYAECPPPVHMTSRSLFPIHAVSPKPIRYKEWQKQRRAVVWIMQPWSWSGRDLFNCLSLHPTFQRVSDKPKLIKDAREFCAPCPRDILEYSEQPDAFVRNAKRSATRLTIENMEAVLYRSTLLDVDEVSNSVLLLKRRTLPNNQSDQPVLEFNSRFIEDRILAYFKLLSLEEALNLSRACEFIPECSTLCGWIFGSLAVWFTSNSMDGHYNNVFGPFKQMVLAPDTEKNTYSDSTFAGSGDNVIIYDTETGTLIQRGDQVLYKETGTPSGIHPKRQDFFTHRKVVYYSDLNDPVVSVDSGNYYVPSERNNILFDAFFFHEQAASTIIWILQMTTAKRHGGANTGFDAVRSLRDIAERTSKSVKVNYMLVSPQREYRVVWKMPTGWDDEKVKGDVFIQYLDLKAIFYLH